VKKKSDMNVNETLMLIVLLQLHIRPVDYDTI